MSIEAIVVGLLMLNPVVAFIVAFVAVWIIGSLLSGLVQSIFDGDKYQIKKMMKEIGKSCPEIRTTASYEKIDDGSDTSYIKVHHCEIDGKLVKFWYDGDSSRYPYSISIEYDGKTLVEHTALYAKRIAKSVHADVARPLY